MNMRRLLRLTEAQFDELRELKKLGKKTEFIKKLKEFDKRK